MNSYPTSRSAAILTLLVVTSCGGTEGAPSSASSGTGGGGAGGDSSGGSGSVGGNAPVGTLAVEVSILAPYPLVGTTPAASAVVALDPPGGDRIEPTTDADGRIVFEGIDWSAGRAAVTAHMPGMPLSSRVGITEDQGSAGRGRVALPAGLIQ